MLSKDFSTTLKTKIILAVGLMEFNSVIQPALPIPLIDKEIIVRKLINLFLDLLKLLQFFLGAFNLTALLNNEKTVFTLDKHFVGIFNLTKGTIENDNVQKLLRDPKEQFDFIIIEYMFSDLYAG